MNVLHLILGCKHSNYILIENAARDTWMRRTPENVKSIFMYGGEYKIFWDENDSFYVNRPESHYANICLYKTIKAFETFIESDFDFIFRTNNTGYFDLYNVIKFLKDKPTEIFYCGYPGKYNKKINFISGSGYFLSKDIVEKIIENQEIIYSYNLPGWCDDVSIGKYITEELNIEINSDCKRINLSPEDITNDLDMGHYHYRILNNGDAESLYRIHELKCKNQ